MVDIIAQVTRRKNLPIEGRICAGKGGEAGLVSNFQGRQFEKLAKLAKH
jgi:hypothetical protein